jgi:hypothetical protein
MIGLGNVIFNRWGNDLRGHDDKMKELQELLNYDYMIE